MKRLKFIFGTILLFTCLLCQSCNSGKTGTSSNHQSYDVAAFYWPNYHYAPRLSFIFEDGKGEWQTVYNAIPKDSVERQPRVPRWGYQNEADPKVMNKKIHAAITHGVNVFIFDWYWFSDKPLLEAALNKGFLVANHNRMKFYIMWANHNATSYWNPRVADKSHIYWTGKVDSAVFHHVVARMIHKYFNQSSYYKIDDKPVFAIYHLKNFIEGLGGAVAAKEALNYFRQKVVNAGFQGLYLQAILWSAIPDSLPGVSPNINSQDEVMQYFGFDSFTNYTWTHLVKPDGDYEKWANAATAIWKKYSNYSIPYFPNVSIGWDNNPRYPSSVKKPYINNSTPEKFKRYLIKAKRYLDAHPTQPKLITINAWNEWAEGSYLEPDTLYKMGYLNAVKAVFRKK